MAKDVNEIENYFEKIVKENVYKKKERENFGLLHCLVLPLSIAVIGGDSSITMSTAAFFFFRRRRE